jgi:hypothetical protein
MKYLLLILSIGFIVGCSDSPSGFETGEVIEASISDNSLTVQNNSIQPIYYFAVESELLIRINYVLVSTDENKIDPFQEVNIPLSDVGVTEPGQQVSFSYWTVQEPELDEVFNILIGSN